MDITPRFLIFAVEISIKGADMSTKNKDESKENDILLVESGKFFLDLAKLTFGGLFLTSILELHYDLVLVLIYGFATIVSLTIFGFVLIKIGNSKK